MWKAVNLSLTVEERRRQWTHRDKMPVKGEKKLYAMKAYMGNINVGPSVLKSTIR